METDEIGNGVEACREPSVLDATVVEATKSRDLNRWFFSGRFEQIKRKGDRQIRWDRKGKGTIRTDNRRLETVKDQGESEGKKVTPEKKSKRIAISELSSEPRAIDVRRKPILVEQEKGRTSESGWVTERKSERMVTSDRTANERRIERMRGMIGMTRMNALKKNWKEKKKWEKIIQREPTSLPTGRSAYI